MKSLYKKILTISIFAISMAFLESAVVIYLREIMYPTGFNFPLAPIQPELALTEILRELATMIMLASVGILAGKTFSQRFAWFIYSFAIWDIFYYVFLWLLIGWPESLMTWDVLFLIPVTWTGPVVTPLLVTLAMIFLALSVLLADAKGLITRICKLEWIELSAGSIVLVVAFTTDYMKYMKRAFSFKDILGLDNPDLISHAHNYIPSSFPWLTFTIGLLIILAAIIQYSFRIRK